jgi:hypothetical protein
VKQLLLAVVVAAAAANGSSASQAAPDQSRIWGWWPVVPWDNQYVRESAWSSVLNEPVNLARRGKAAEERRYQIKRVNLTVDRRGKVVSRMVAEGDLSRKLVREVEPGVWAEQCEWQRFAAAQGTGPDSFPNLQELPGARGLSYEFSPLTFDYVNPPVDFARVGDETLGYLLKVLTMDVMGGDAVLGVIRDELKSKVRIGDTSRQTQFAPWDITRVGGEGTVGRYHVGEMQVSVMGLTRVHGEPCVLIWLSMEGNEVNQKMETPQLSLDMQSTEYFRGEVSASLLDGRVVGMELWGPLPSVMKMGFGGQPPVEQPIGAIIQQVSMWEVPAAQASEAPGR